MLLHDYINNDYYIIDNRNQECVDKFKPNLFINSTSPDINGFANHTQLKENNIDIPSLSEIKNLASVVELSPIPIVEINYEGTITYLNPSTNLKFPDLQKRQIKHPLLQGLLEKQDYNNGSLVIREVDIENQSFE